MTEAPRAAIPALLALILAGAGSATGSPPRISRPTIEPTLPLVVDVRVAGLERSGGRARGRLEIDLRAHGRLEQIELSVALPEALRALEGGTPPSGFGMEDGERRLIAFRLEGPADRDLPIRLGATFRTEDGRVFRLGHGVTLEAPRPAAEGRSRLGAMEVMAVPLEALRR